MDPVRKELACPACGKPSVVRVVPGAGAHVWHCPHCGKIQSTDGPAADTAPTK